MPSSEQKKIQLRVCGMQFHLVGILFGLTNEYALFSFCPRAKKESRLCLQECRKQREAKPSGILNKIQVLGG